MATIDLGQVRGQNGVSPSITVTDIEGGHRVTITDANGTKSFDVMDGKNGSVDNITINGKSSDANGNFTINANDVGAAESSHTHSDYAEKEHSHDYVPTSRVNQDLNTTSAVKFSSVTADVVYGAVFME